MSIEVPFTMSIEVEQKFRVAGFQQLERLLKERAVPISTAEQQVDCYFAHPARDFAATDEALRIRRVGQQNFITYKGPKLDATTKTRREIELPLAQGLASAADFAELLQALGFRPVAEVRKQRRHAELTGEGHAVVLALDEVEGVGAFVELEVVVEADQVDAARQRLAEWAERLGLKDNERRSYLELLLDSLQSKSS